MRIVRGYGRPSDSMNNNDVACSGLDFGSSGFRCEGPCFGDLDRDMAWQVRYPDEWPALRETTSSFEHAARCFYNL